MVKTEHIYFQGLNFLSRMGKTGFFSSGRASEPVVLSDAQRAERRGRRAEGARGNGALAGKTR